MAICPAVRFYPEAVQLNPHSWELDRRLAEPLLTYNRATELLASRRQALTAPRE